MIGARSTGRGTYKLVVYTLFTPSNYLISFIRGKFHGGFTLWMGLMYDFLILAPANEEPCNSKYQDSNQIESTLFMPRKQTLFPPLLHRFSLCLSPAFLGFLYPPSRVHIKTICRHRGHIHTHIQGGCVTWKYRKHKQVHMHNVL